MSLKIHYRVRQEKSTMKLFHALLLSIALPWLGGCESVWTPQPLGDEAVVLDETWSGSWLVGEGVVHTVVLDAAQGRLQLAWVEPEEHGAALESLTGTVRSGAGQTFFNVLDEETENGYHWAVVDHRPERILIWYPDPEAFVAAVTEGRLPGRVVEGSVVLGELDPNQLGLLGKPDSALLKWREPLVMVRFGPD